MENTFAFESRVVNGTTSNSTGAKRVELIFTADKWAGVLCITAQGCLLRAVHPEMRNRPASLHSPRGAGMGENLPPRTRVTLRTSPELVGAEPQLVGTSGITSSAQSPLILVGHGGRSSGKNCPPTGPSH